MHPSRRRPQGLGDDPAPSPAEITDEQSELVIAKMLDKRGPAGKGTDSRSMATAAVVRQWVISRIWERSASTPQLWVNEPDEARRGASLADVNFQPTHGGAITS